MHALMLSEIAEALNCPLHGPDRPIMGVSIDSRSVQAGELFIALKGPNFDGHQFIADAHARGAVALMVTDTPDGALPYLCVQNSHAALGRLAQYYRTQFLLPLVAITGSSGKTTVKEMLRSILSQVGPVLSNPGNYNNEIGLPLTLLQLGAHHQFAVLEMGARQQGDIAHLSALAQPSVALITNIGQAHLGIFGSKAQVASTKAEIFDALSRNGIGIINQDDPYASQWTQQLASRQTITFSLDRMSDITCAHLVSEPNATLFELVTDIGSVPIKLNLPGLHNVRNALAAAAAARALGIYLSDIQKGLNQFKPIDGRLQVKPGLAGSVVIDDSYNANPESMKAAIDVLKASPQERSTYFIIGDMFELGTEAASLHQEVGEAAKQAGIQHLYALGAASRHAVEAFGAGAQHFSDKTVLLETLRPQLDALSTILIKGSRGMHMEDLVDSLTATIEV